MANELIKYDAACRALAAAKSVDEVKQIRNASEAIRLYAKQAKNKTLEADAAEIRFRAERRLGEMLKDSDKAKGGDQYKKIPLSTGAKTEPVPTLSDLGIDKKLSSRAQKLAAVPQEKFENLIGGWRENIKKETEKVTTDLIKNGEKEQRIAKEQAQRKGEISSIEIRRGNFKDVLSDIYNIDAIITDPPYPIEFIACFSELGIFAKNHLKPDGFIAVYSGQYHLPEVIKRLSEHLTYVWTFCLYHVGQKQLVNGVNIMCGWKPVLIFSNGKKKMRFSAYDVLVSEQMEKHSHEWQQSKSGVKQLIEIFSEPGQLVCDPFSGSGTFLNVANDLGRKTIGAEIK